MNEKHQQKPRSVKSKLSRVLLWLLVIGIFAYLFLFRLSIFDVIARAAGMDPYIFISVVLVFCLFTLSLDSYTHQWVFNRFGLSIPYREAFILRAKTYFLLSLGFLYGQGGMAYFTSRRTNTPLADVSGWVVFIMFCNLQVLLIFPTLAIIFLLDRLGSVQFRQSEEFGLIVTWLFITWPLVIGQLVFFARDWKIGLRQKLKEGAFSALDRAGWKDYAYVMFLRGLQTFAWLFATYIALRAFELRIPLLDLMIRGPLLGLISVIPTPGRLGTSQGAWLLLFSDLGDEAALVAFSLVWVLGISLLRWLIGVVFLALDPAGKK